MESLSKYQRARARPKCKDFPLESGDAILGGACREMLGEGRTAKVYSIEIRDHVHAVKMYQCGKTSMRYWQNEVKILNIMRERALTTGTTPPNIVPFVSHDLCVLLDSALMPRVYPNITFALGNMSLSNYLRWYIDQFESTPPLAFVTNIAKKTAEALAFMHGCNIVHTDIKPGNILLGIAANEITNPDFPIMLADFGTATTCDKLFSKHVGTIEYCSPELILSRDYDTSTDVWAFACMIFKLLTGDMMFDVLNCDEIKYGSDVDEECIIEDAHESSTRDSQEHTAQDIAINYRMFMLIFKLVGRPPQEFCKRAKEYFTNRGHLLSHPDIRTITLEELMRQYEIPQLCVEFMTMIARECLHWIPSQRSKAEKIQQLIISFEVQQRNVL